MSEEIERIIKECSCVDTFDYVITPQQRDTMRLAENIKELQQENQQLKEDYSKLLETSKAYKKLLKTTMQKEHQAIKVLDEIREYINKCYYTIDGEKIVYQEDIEEILDKAKE